MVQFDSEESIRRFILSNGLDKDLLDESSESLEAWLRECNLLVKGFFRHFEDRFTRIGRRLDRLEQLVGERSGHRRDEICP